VVRTSKAAKAAVSKAEAVSKSLVSKNQQPNEKPGQGGQQGGQTAPQK